MGYATSSTRDVVIAGGGVIGSAIAYFLAAGNRGSIKGITVVEKDPTYKFSSTTLSAASIRHQFSTPENIQMSMYGSHFLKNLDQYLSLPEGSGDVDKSNSKTVVDAQFKEGGYLFLASNKKQEEGTMGGKDVLEANYKVQKKLGADVVLLSPEGITQKFPWISVEGIAAGAFGQSGEGWFDPSSLLMGFKQKAQSLGVSYIKDEVVGLEVNQQRARVEKVTTKSGRALNCGLLVNAAGAQAHNIARMIGEEGLPVRARKRCVFVFDCKDRSINNSPLVIDPSGVYWRPETSGRFICGISPEVDPDVASTDFEVDFNIFEEVIWPVLAERVPSFEAIKMAGAWAGHYDYNTFDQNAILGPHPVIKNFYFANGFSGHGLQQGPAVGRAISELILEGRYTSLDLSAFSFERIKQNKPIIELNVV